MFWIVKRYSKKNRSTLFLLFWLDDYSDTSYSLFYYNFFLHLYYLYIQFSKKIALMLLYQAKLQMVFEEKHLGIYCFSYFCIIHINREVCYFRG